MQMYDTIVIGGSFAGLSYAINAAKLGQKILVIERNSEIGAKFATTGVLGRKSVQALGIDSKFLRNDIRKISNSFPNGTNIAINFQRPRYYMLDIPEYYKQLYSDALAAGVEFELGASVVSIKTEKQHNFVIYRQNGKLHCLQSKYICGADGALSTTAKSMSLSTNKEFLTGSEWVVSLNKPIRGEFHLLFDPELSPGYCAWVAPYGYHAVVGVAAFHDRFQPGKNLEKVIAYFQTKLDIQVDAVVEKKAGLIPVGGVLPRIITERAVLVGDAAGLCGPLKGNGIYTALYSGKLAAEIVSGYLTSNNPLILRAYRPQLEFIEKHYYYRKLFNLLYTDRKINLISMVLATRLGRKLLELAANGLFLKPDMQLGTGKKKLYSV